MLVSCLHARSSRRRGPVGNRWSASWDGAVDSWPVAARSETVSVIASDRRGVAGDGPAQIVGNGGPRAGQQQHADGDEQQPTGPDDDAVVPLYDGEGAERVPEGKAGDDERDSESEAVDEGEKRSAACRRGVVLHGQVEHHRERRPRARCPADSEKNAEKGCPDQTGLRQAVQAPLPLAPWKDTDEHDAEQDRNNTADS